MIVKLIFFCLISLLTHSSWAKNCQIEFYPKLYKFGHRPHKNTLSSIKKSNCPKEVQKKYATALLNTQGVIHRSQLKEFIDTDNAIALSPRAISVTPINEYLSKVLQIDKSMRFEKLKTIKINILALENEQILAALCENCQSPGNKNIKLSIQHTISQKSDQIHWARADLTIRTAVLVAKENLKSQSKNLATKFKKISIYTKTPNQYMSTKAKLKFYKLNKNILAQTPLESTDLTPLKLVKMGRPVNAVAQNKNIVISTKAISNENGYYNSSIELYNPKTRKKFFGTVVDFDEVRINL